LDLLSGDILCQLCFCSFQIIGAAGGKLVADRVVLETDRETVVMFVEGAQQAYLGYVTLKFSPDSAASSAPHHKHYCLEIKDSASSIVDHCIIRSLSAGKELVRCSLFSFG